MRLQLTEEAERRPGPISFTTKSSISADPYWYDPKNLDPGPGMVSLAKEIEKGNASQRTRNLKMARLWQDRRMASVYDVSGSDISEEQLTPKRVSWNIVRSAVGVAQSRVGKNRGRVMFVSVDGDWSLRRKARLRTRFVDGAFRQAKVYEEWRKVFNDACVFGLGLLYVFSDDKGKLCSERVLPDECFVDPGEGIDGRPPTIYRRKRMHKRAAISAYAGKPGTEGYDRKVAAINGAPMTNPLLGQRSPMRTEMIDVWASWRLPQGDEPGRHVIAVEGCTLHEEAWNRPRLPFVPFRWEDAISGWYGLGIAEQLEGTQLELRRTLHTIQQGHYHGSQFKWLVAKGTSVSAQQFNNDPRGGIVTYDSKGGAPPQPVAPSGVNAAVPDHLERMWRQGFDQVGLPPAGSGAVPTNIKSGEGIRAYTEAVDSRLSVPQQRGDQFFVDVADVMLDEVRDIGGAVTVESKVGRSYQRINWKDIAEGDDDFVLQAWPASLLPQTPSGRYDRLNEMVQAGWISKEQALSILDVPDLEGIVSLETSSLELISRALERMLDEGIDEQPEPYQNLSLSLRIAQDAYLKARADGAPEDRLRLVRDYIDAVRDLTKAAAAEQAQQPAPGSQPAPGAGATLPGAPPDAAGAPPAMAA